MIGSERVSGRARIARRHQPVHSGQRQSRMTSPKGSGLPARLCCSSSARPSSAVAAKTGGIDQPSHQGSSSSRLDGESSTISTGRSVTVGGATCPGWSCADSIAKRAVKMKVVPWPGVLSNVRSPPMSRASRRLIASPSPVPPYWRDVEVSACMKAWNSFPCCSWGIPIPVSRTVARSVGMARRVVGNRHDLHAQLDLALVGKLERVADEIGQHLPEAERIPHEPVRNGRQHVRNQLHVLLDHRRPERLGHLLEHGPHAERRFFELQLVRVNLREVENVVEDPEQVAGRRVGDAHELVRFRGEIALERQPAHVDDRVHRRADLVAHHREERSLGLIGRHGLLPRRHQLAMRRLQRGDGIVNRPS